MAIVNLLSLLSIVPALALAAPLVERDGPSYSSTVSGLVPFIDNDSGSWDFSNGPAIAYKLDNTPEGHLYQPPLDTGSTGILIGSSLYPDINYPKDTPGYEYLSSSQRLYTGHWVTRQIYFQGGDNVVAEVPVLVVETQVICNNYSIANPDVCPDVKTEVCGTANTKACASSYFGVGFGRQKDKSSQSTPDKNAFTNIKSIKEEPVQSNFNQGYTLTPAGIQVGLTASNTAGYNMIKLGPNPYGGWLSVPGCLQVSGPNGSGANGTCAPSTFLMDTGIPQSYLTAIPANGITGWKTSKITGNKFQTFPSNYKVTANYGTAAPYSVTFSFTTGSQDTDQPSYVSASLDTTTGDSAFLNTGLYFFKTHNIVFDATQGYYGIKASS